MWTLSSRSKKVLFTRWITPKKSSVDTLSQAFSCETFRRVKPRSMTAFNLSCRSTAYF